MRPYLVVSAPSVGVLNVCEAKNVSLLAQNEEHMIFRSGSLSLSVYQVDTGVIHVIKMFPDLLNEAS